MLIEGKRENVMKIFTKNGVSLAVGTTLILSASLASASHPSTIEVSLTNISNVVFTPPIVALCKKKMPAIAKIGQPASDLLEPLAEGGDTSGLAGLFADNNCSYAMHSGAVAPGESITLEVSGRKRDYLHFASMLLPTNDGFIYSSGYRVKQIKSKGKLWLKSYDAGTEANDELCVNIPGPQCGGEGFNAKRETNNFVKPHSGIQGFNDVSAQTYNWGNPVAYIKIK